MITEIIQTIKTIWATIDINEAIRFVVSIGLIAIILHYYYRKRLNTHAIRIEKYMRLIEELSKGTARVPNWDNLNTQLNAALVYASNDVVTKILDLYDEVTKMLSCINQQGAKS